MADFALANEVEPAAVVERQTQHWLRINQVVPFQLEDLDMFFAQFEDNMRHLQATSQRQKRSALLQCLPAEVQGVPSSECCKPFEQALADADNNAPYKVLKDLVLETFGPDPEQHHQRFNNTLMTGKPSEFLAKLCQMAAPNINCEQCRKMTYSAFLEGV